MGEDIFDNITNFRFVSFDETDYENIDHFTMCYIDDTTNCIAGRDAIVLQKYLQRYFNLLHYFFTCNRLCLNEDKTQLLVVSKKHLLVESKNLHLISGEYDIKQSDNVKILGYYLNVNLNHDTYINKIISKINFRLL